ncbi:MAG TPA: hypothetical protein VFS24_06330 [Steroidobacteraceae bacterium]|nr:hypothetical protein [Steroidobacteraceae bacterium]
MINAWLISLGLSATSAKWIARALVLLLLVVIAAVLYANGFTAGTRNIERKFNEQAIKDLQKARDEEARLTNENTRLTVALQAERNRDHIVYRTITQKVPYVVKEFVHLPATSDAHCTVRNDFVWLWNDATFARVPSTAGSTADGPARAGDAQADSGIGAADLLGNHVANAEVNNQIRSQCERLIQWHREHDR